MDVQSRPTYRIETFGGISVSGGDAPLTGAATQRKTLLLLAVLAASGQAGIARDKLVGLFWPDSDEARARHALKQALHTLRRDFRDPDLVLGTPILRLNPESIASDIQEFEEAMGQGDLERAVSLHRGPFLDGLWLDGSPEFERWLERERARLAHLYASALEKLATRASASGDHRRAAEWWRRLAATDPLSSRVAVDLMKALAAAGDPEAALQHARVHEALVREELETAPDSAVAALAARIRRELDAPPAQATHAGGRDWQPARTDGSVGDATSATAGGPPPEVTIASASPVAITEPTLVASIERTGPSSGGWRRMLAVAAALLLAAAGLFAAKRALAPDRAPVAVADRSIAVLPFVDMSAGGDHAWFADGLSEELITTLSHVEGLRVAARTSSFALRDAKLDVRALGDTLGVAAILEGSVRRDGDRLRVTAQLIDARSGYHLWSGAYDRRMTELFAVQDELSREIASALQVQLGTPPATLASRTANPEAYDLYLRGIWFRSRLTPEAIARATEYFDRAIALDSGYALAWAGKATTLAPLVYFGHGDRTELLRQIRLAAERAIALDENLGEAHVALGVIHFFYEFDWPASERDLRRAVALSPGDAHAWHHLANWMRAMGRSDSAIAMRRRSLELDPLNPRIALLLGIDLMTAGRHDEALAAYERGVDIDSMNPLLLGGGPSLPVGPAEVFERRGELARAVDEYVRVARRRGATPAEQDELRRAFASGGMPAFWRRWLDFDQRTGGSPRPLRMARTWLRIGDRERALDLLEQAYRDRDPGLVYLAVTPNLAELRDEPRFADILRRMRLAR